MDQELIIQKWIIVKLAGSLINLKSTQFHSSEHEITLDYIPPDNITANTDL